MCEQERVMTSSVNCVPVFIPSEGYLMCKVVEFGMHRSAQALERLPCHAAHLVHAGRVHFHDRRVCQSLKHSLEVLPVVDGLVLEHLQQAALIHHLMHEVTHY